jgi:hypothetical protein
MRLTYVGPHDAVEVQLPDGEFIVAERNKPVEIPDAVAKSLAKQDGWKTKTKDDD